MLTVRDRGFLCWEPAGQPRTRVQNRVHLQYDSSANALIRRERALKEEEDADADR